MQAHTCTCVDHGMIGAILPRHVGRAHPMTSPIDAPMMLLAGFAALYFLGLGVAEFVIGVKAWRARRRESRTR